VSRLPHAAVNVDVLGAHLGWRFYVSGAVYVEGWRPTRTWAFRAAERARRQALGRMRAVID